MSNDLKTCGGDQERPAIIRTISLVKTYGEGECAVRALDGVDATVLRGEFISLLGPSGSGKSTFFNMVGALDSPTSGRVLIDELDIAQMTAVELAFLRCRKIGYVFQTFNLIRYMTALENVTVPMSFAGVNPEEARRRGMHLLELVGLADRWCHRPIEMSGGQQQRVAIARALGNNPRIVLCDEPTGNLDLKTGEDILAIMRRINQTDQVTIICATHDLRLLNVSDRMFWIRDGRIQRVDNREDVTVRIGSIGEGS